MKNLLKDIQILVWSGDFVVSNHAYDELMADDIYVADIISGIHHAEVIESYPDYRHGPCVLVKQVDRGGAAIHVLWGIPGGKQRPAVVVTAYRPDPGKWSGNSMRRIK